MIQRRRFLKAAAGGVAGGLCLCGKLRAEEAKAKAGAGADVGVRSGAGAEAGAPADLSAALKMNFGSGRG